MKHLGLPFAAAVLVALGACADRPTDVTVPDDPLGPALGVLDGTQPGGNEHFFWLPPLGASHGGFEGVVDPTRPAVVEICVRDEAADDGCSPAEPLTARFTRDSGRQPDRIKVDGKGEYFAHWRMKDFPPQQGGEYRIRVLVDDSELGHADVVTLRQRDIKAYAGDLIPISDQGALKIGFRIEEGAVCDAGDPTCATGDARILGSIVNDRDGDLKTIDPGEALFGATVRLSVAGSVLAETTTDGNGRYEFGDLVAGSYLVEVVAPGWPVRVVRSQDVSGAAEIAVVVPTDASTVGELRGGYGNPFDLPAWDYDANLPINVGETHFTFLYEDGTVRGRASTGAGAAVAGMTVTLRRCSTSAGATSPPTSGACLTSTFPTASAVTDASGTFALLGLLEGVYEVVPQPVTAGFTTSTPAQALTLLVGSNDLEFASFVIS